MTPLPLANVVCFTSPFLQKTTLIHSLVLKNHKIMMLVKFVTAVLFRRIEYHLTIVLHCTSTKFLWRAWLKEKGRSCVSLALRRQQGGISVRLLFVEIRCAKIELEKEAEAATVLNQRGRAGGAKAPPAAKADAPARETRTRTLRSSGRLPPLPPRPQSLPAGEPAPREPARPRPPVVRRKVGGEARLSADGSSTSAKRPNRASRERPDGGSPSPRFWFSLARP